MYTWWQCKRARCSCGSGSGWKQQRLRILIRHVDKVDNATSMCKIDPYYRSMCIVAFLSLALFQVLFVKSYAVR